MGFIGNFSELSMILTIAMSLVIAVCVIAIVWAVMLLVEKSYDGKKHGKNNYDVRKSLTGNGRGLQAEAVSGTAAPAGVPAGSAKMSAAQADGGADDGINDLDDEELTAVIAAAIAAYTAAGGAGKLIVRKIKRISGGDTPWSSAARMDQAGSRRA